MSLKLLFAKVLPTKRTPRDEGSWTLTANVSSATIHDYSIRPYRYLDMTAVCQTPRVLCRFPISVSARFAVDFCSSCDVSHRRCFCCNGTIAAVSNSADANQRKACKANTNPGNRTAKHEPEERFSSHYHQECKEGGERFEPLPECLFLHLSLQAAKRDGPIAADFETDASGRLE